VTIVLSAGRNVVDGCQTGRLTNYQAVETTSPTVGATTRYICDYSDNAALPLSLQSRCLLNWATGVAAHRCEPGTRFTKYLTTILRSSYDHAEVTIDLRRASNLRKHLARNTGLFSRTVHLQMCKIVHPWQSDSVRKLACDIPGRTFSTF